MPNPRAITRTSSAGSVPPPLACSWTTGTSTWPNGSRACGSSATDASRRWSGTLISKDFGTPSDDAGFRPRSSGSPSSVRLQHRHPVLRSVVDRPGERLDEPRDLGRGDLLQPARIRKFGDRREDGQAPEQRDPVLLGDAGDPARAEQVGSLVAVGADKPGHVLYHTEQRNVEVAGHVHRFLHD